MTNPSTREDHIIAAYASGTPIEAIQAAYGAAPDEIRSLIAGNPPPSAAPRTHPVIASMGKRPLWWAAGALAGLLAVVGGTVAATLAAVEPTTAASTATAPVEDTEVEDVSIPDPTPTTGPTLEVGNIELTPKITRKQCFGSAGCNVELKVEMGYGGPKLSDEDTWEVTYEITGDEDGPVIGTIEVTGTTYEGREESLSTRSNNTKIKIKVTSVDKLGI